MIFTFLLCFLSLIFSIYCIGIQPANASSKLDSNLCNPWEEVGCPFSKEYLGELEKFFESDEKYLPNIYPKPPSYVYEIKQVAKEVGKDAAVKTLEKVIENLPIKIVSKEVAKNIGRALGSLIGIALTTALDDDQIDLKKRQKDFCKKNPDSYFCQSPDEKKKQFCKKNSDALKCKQPENWTCQVNPNTGKIECVSSPLKPNWVCGVNPNTGKDECVDSNNSPNYYKPNYYQPNYRDCNGLDLQDAMRCIFDNADEAIKARNHNLNEDKKLIDNDPNIDPNIKEWFKSIN